MRERKPIDPALRHYLDEQSALAEPLPADNIERAHAIRSAMLRARTQREEIPGLPNQVTINDVVIAGGLAARIYFPQTTASAPPALLYFHGGGWVTGSIATHDPFCRLLSGASGAAVVSVEYRLAPEHPYPAAIDDVLTAIDSIERHAAEWGIDSNRFALGGDSAGGQLAAVAANKLCAARAAHPFRALLLLYPATDHYSANYLSYTENATGYGLEAERMCWLWDQYARDTSPDDPAISPLRLTEIPALPPTLIATAEYDVLRDEAIAYADRLRSAGVDVKHVHAPDMHHNFPVHPATVALFPQCESALAEFARWLSEQLNTSALCARQS